MLANPGSTPMVFQELFFGSDGNLARYKVQLPSNNTSLTTSAIQGTLGPGASMAIVLPDQDGNVQEGWSLLNFDSTQGTLQGYAVIQRKTANGGILSETALPWSQMKDFSVRLLFDNTMVFQTKLTLVNPSSGVAANVTLSYFSNSGKLILADAVSLPPGGEITISLPDTYPDLANTAGVISIAADTNCLAVGALKENAASGVIAAIPVL
jgi:hypothetical protein